MLELPTPLYVEYYAPELIGPGSSTHNALRELCIWQNPVNFFFSDRITMTGYTMVTGINAVYRDNTCVPLWIAQCNYAPNRIAFPTNNVRGIQNENGQIWINLDDFAILNSRPWIR